MEWGCYSIGRENGGWARVEKLATTIELQPGSSYRTVAHNAHTQQAVYPTTPIHPPPPLDTSLEGPEKPSADIDKAEKRG